MVWRPNFRRLLDSLRGSLRSSLNKSEAIPYALSTLLHVVVLSGAVVWLANSNLVGSLVLDGGGGTGGDSILPGAPGGSQGGSVIHFQVGPPSNSLAESAADQVEPMPTEPEPPIEQPPIEPLVTTQPSSVADVITPVTEQPQPAEIVTEKARPPVIQSPTVQNPSGPLTLPEVAATAAVSRPPEPLIEPDFSSLEPPAAMPRRSRGASQPIGVVRVDLPPDVQAGSGGSGEGAGTGPRTGAGSGAGGAGGNADSLPRTGSGNRKPPYPPDALLAGYEGTVILLVSVAADGTVESIAVHQTSGWASMDESALKGVKAWRFNPARAGGVPVPFTVRVPIEFRIRPVANR